MIRKADDFLPGRRPDSQPVDPIAQFIEEVLRSPKNAAQIEWLEHQPARPARFAEESGGDGGGEGGPREDFYGLDGRLKKRLQERGIDRLYSHQAQAIRRIQSGANVVVVSGTASGKTLCYNLPVLDHFLRGGKGYALYLFPTKALAQDQMRTLEELLSGLGLEVEAGVFDGDTEPALRLRLRRSGRIIFTNPDMLHRTILPHHGGWAGLFTGLRFVVIDEIHSLRGIFGSNVANVLRRLRRLAAHYGSKPQFIAASATIANPREQAERLAGEPFEVVDEDGSPRGERTYVFWNPPVEERPDGSRYRKGPLSVAVRVLPELLQRGIRTIGFCQARSTVELILRYVWDRLKGNASTRPLAEKLESYRAGYLPQERRQIEKRLFRGELLGVVSTNALELGIDIGGLDAALMVSYPGTIASFRQRAGRAGRRSGRSLVVLIGGSEPIDQYFMRHPEAFFEKSPESAVIESDNPYILTKHLVCAAYELPLGDQDADLFAGGDRKTLRGILQLLGEAGQLREAEGKWHYIENDFPARKVKLRTVGEENFTIYESGNQRIIGELDYVAGLLSLYEGAIYIHRSETHFVEELDVTNQIARLRKDDSGYYTQALCQKKVRADEKIEARPWRQTALELAEVTVETRITGYKKVRFNTAENIGYGEVALPPIILETVALHLDIPQEMVERAMRFGADFFQSGLHGLSRLFTSLMPLFVMADPRDIDYFIDGRRIFVYDLYSGGIGYAEKAYERFEEILAAALDHLTACRCPSGCPSCVLPAFSSYEIAMEPSIKEFPYPKEAARCLLHDLLEKEPYLPRLEPGVVGPREAAIETREPIDPRLAGRVRRALKQL
ncbi:MAG: DEAD/DEAH box helicase [Planctomycetes bacterium]|nr:DEAD/DEAH box helicase [Planctomycetota bacterium]